MADAPDLPTAPAPDASASSESTSSSPPPPSSSPPSAPSSPPTPPGRALDAELARARQVLGRVVLAEAAVAVVAAVVAAALAAVVVLELAPFSMGLRAALLGGIGTVAVAAAVHVWFWQGRFLRRDLFVAARLEEALARRGAAIGDGIRGAVELRDSAIDDRLGRSRALCDAHIDRIVVAIKDGGARESLPAVGLERAVPTLLGAAAVFSVLVVSLAVGHETIRTRLTQLISPTAAAVAVAERAAAEPPLVTDITLTLRYPAYMARADEVIPGASGDVTAPRGTEVLVEGRADADVTAAALVVTGGPQELTLKADVEGRTVRGRFTVSAPGAWRFTLRDGGRERVDPVARKILVKADAAPTVRLEHPSADETVKPEDEIKVVYGAEDDFGLMKARLVVKRQGSSREPFVVDLGKDLGGVKQSSGGGSFVVEDVGARPGEKLSLTVEVEDNDTVSGPNVGRSVTRVLTVFSAAAHHREVIERLEQLMGQMVEVLGDELEAPVPDNADVEAQRRTLERHAQLVPRAQAMLTFFDETLTAVADDNEFDDDDGVRRALANMRLEVARSVAGKRASIERAPKPEARALPLGIWRRIVDAQLGLVNRLESDILYLEDLLQRERLREASKLVEDLKQAQQDLKSLLQQYKENGDPQAREALLDEIKRMQQQLAELAARLGELRREVPDEFLNEEAFKADDMMENAASLDELIEEGRLEDAAAALEEMLKSTEQMMDELEKANDEVGGDESKALREKLERFSEDLSSLEQAQKDALEETEAIMEKARKKAEERLGDRFKQALAEAKKKAAQARDALQKVDPVEAGLNRYEEEDTDAAVARTDDLQRALESGDIDDALRAAEEAESAARSASSSVDDRQGRRGAFKSAASKRAEQALKDAAEALQEAREKLEQMSPDPSELLDGRDRERLQKNAERQAQLEEQAQKLSEQMAEVGKEAPIFGPQHQQQLEAAREAMQRAQQRLKGQSRPRPERGGLRQGRQAQSQALQQLQGLREAMEEMGKQKGQGMPMPLPNSGAPGSERSEGERGKNNREDVKIPDGSDFKVKDAFRKDILDAMRESAPGEWAGEVKRYYEELIK